MNLPITLDRPVVILARPATVWRFLSTDAGWSAWWGTGSTIDARPGGAMHIVFSNGQTAEGEVLEVDPERRIRFTWGYDREDAPIPVGGSEVELTLTAVDDGTRVHLVHRVADDDVAGMHAPGWRHQLGVLRSIVGAEAHGHVAARIDAWHGAWATDEPVLDDVLVPDASVEEPMASLRGIDDVVGWIRQSRAVAPATVRRIGPPALCGARVTWDWAIEGMATGRSVADLDPDGRFRAVTAFWLTAPPGFPTSTLG
ncbi:MAG: putative regulatory protein (ArsR-family) [Actinomycetia bacterium]|nr:putative regulatory protein (ArsR-family) [Actinomycetes bacterium]